MEQNTHATSSIGRALQTNRLAKIGEILAIFAVAAIVIFTLIPLAGENPLARQGVVWVANVSMIGMDTILLVQQYVAP